MSNPYVGHISLYIDDKYVGGRAYANKHDRTRIISHWNNLHDLPAHYHEFRLTMRENPKKIIIDCPEVKKIADAYRFRSQTHNTYTLAAQYGVADTTILKIIHQEFTVPVRR